MRELKPYMAYSHEQGPREAAILVFAHTVSGAKRLAWSEMKWDIVDEYIDVAVRLIRDNLEFIRRNADQGKLLTGVPHVIGHPITCHVCNIWSYPVGLDGLCDDCRDEGDE